MPNKRHKWNPSGQTIQTCDHCKVHRVATLEGWLYTWPDGRSEERDVDDHTPPCASGEDVKETVAHKDWWNR